MVDKWWAAAHGLGSNKFVMVYFAPRLRLFNTESYLSVRVGIGRQSFSGAITKIISIPAHFRSLVI